MKDAFQIAWRGLWRGKTFWTLLAAVVAAHLLLPGLVRSDGTFAGRFEMHVRVVFGAVTALVCMGITVLVWQLHRYPAAFFSTLAGYGVTYVIMGFFQYRRLKSDIQFINEELKES